MKITVRLFALGRELVGAEQLTLEVAENSSVETVVNQLKETYPPFSRLNSFLLAVNMEYVEPSAVLAEGDELAIIPPVSGG